MTVPAPRRRLPLLLVPLLALGGLAAARAGAEPHPEAHAEAHGTAPADKPAPARDAPAAAEGPDKSAAPNVVEAARAAEAKGLLGLGSSLSERKDYAAAEIAYRQILNSTKYTRTEKIDALLGLARMFRQEGSLTKTAAIYEKYLKDFPDHPQVPDVLLDLGRTLRAMGAYRLAIARFYNVLNSTLKLPGDNYDHYQLLAKTAQFEIAETQFMAGNFTEAAKYFSRLRLLDLAPADRARAHFKSAYALQLAGDNEGAVTTLRAYLDQWPDDENVPEARYLLATTLRRLNRPEESLAATMALLRSEKRGADPARWAYWQRRTGNQLANEFFQAGDTLNALAIYQGLSALANDPAWRLPITYQIALCHERLRLVDQARTAYRSIIDTVKEAATAKPAAGASAAIGNELNDLAKMAEWRLANLTWTDDTEHRLTNLFTNKTGATAATAPATPATPAHELPGSPAAASEPVR